MLLNLHDYESRARASAEPAVWDYIEGGSGDEVTLRENTRAFRRLHLRPRVLRGVGEVDLSTRLLGQNLSLPLLLAPVGYQCLAHEDGECASARAAAAVGSLMVVSTMASRTLEAIAEAGAAPLWFQLYVMKDRGLTEELVRRAEHAGYRAVVLTVDAPRLGTRERDLRNGFAFPAHLRAANLPCAHDAALARAVAGASAASTHAEQAFEPRLTWETVLWLRSLGRLPVVIKGILTAEDARLATEHGAAGVIVSNHGGRQLDGAPAPIDVLAEVVSAVAGRCDVLLDGGIRRGSDALKARALGAAAVLVGRPLLWGLMVGGEVGVRGVLERLRDELALAMKLTGQARWRDVEPGVVAIARQPETKEGPDE